ncbi:MAG: hypothetical protein M0P71_16595 [Melioribacteraceae bacterium]|nr:hypothetical protein [Melioribacteraceae bacterium]
MDYSGTWENEKTSEIIRINSVVNKSDTFLFEWEFKANVFIKQEEIQILIIDNSISHFSAQNSSGLIHNLNENSILINGEKFIKHETYNY